MSHIQKKDLNFLRLLLVFFRCRVFFVTRHFFCMGIRCLKIFSLVFLESMFFISVTSKAYLLNR